LEKKFLLFIESEGIRTYFGHSGKTLGTDQLSADSVHKTSQFCFILSVIIDFTVLHFDFPSTL